MQIKAINNISFGLKFKLSKETTRAVEKSTGLTYKELIGLPLEDAGKLMKKRGTLKEPNKFFVWISEKYRQLGEELGLLEKRYNIYTDID